MRRLFTWAFAALMIAVTTGLMVVNAQQRPGAALIAGDRPVTEEQVRNRLQTDGWSDVRIYRDGQYFRVTASKGGETSQMAVDAQTGRLGGNNDDDDD